jgi:hypothetical protein
MIDARLGDSFEPFNNFDLDDDSIDSNHSVLKDFEMSHSNSPNSELIDRSKKQAKSGAENVFGEGNPEFHSSVRLLELQRKYGCPLKMVKELVDWAKFSNRIGVDFNSEYFSSREKVLKGIEDRFDLGGLEPKEQSYKLKGTGEEVPIITVDFKESLYSLLSDPEIMDPKNLIDTPSVDDDPTSVIDDINTGSVWQQAETIYINDPSSEKFIPLVFYG